MVVAGESERSAVVQPKHRHVDFGDLLRQARRRAGLTQEALAERTGLSARGISDLERGFHRAPHRETLNLLADALGLTGPERSEWERARRRLSTRAGGAGPPAPSRPHAAAPQLPTPLTPLIGREREVRAVGSLLRDPTNRLVTITGAGGVGKTRLAPVVARAVAVSYSGGVHFVDLSSIGDAGLVVTTIAAALSVREAGDRPLRESLIAFIADRRLLLVLDNCEHVVGAAPDVLDLLARCPRLQVLATSRARLHVSGEQEYALLPLHVPEDVARIDPWRARESEAVELFVQRARSVKPDFDLSGGNAADVVAICQRLDGLPLAIELAAARAKLLSPAEILSRLEQPLALLTGGARDLPARQRTMRETIRWSYELLKPEEQTLLRQLSAFVGGWTLDAAESVSTVAAEMTANVLDHLGSLVDYSLVSRREQPGGETRYTMLETVRAFGLEEMDRLGQLSDALGRHARYVVDLGEDAEPGLRDHRQRAWFARLLAEQGNIRAVLRRSLVDGVVDVNHGRRLAVALIWFWFTHNRFREARDWLALAATAPVPPDDLLQARASVGLGMMHWRTGEVAEALPIVRETLNVLRRAEDQWHVCFALHHLAHLTDEAGDPERAIDLFRDSIDGYRALGDPWGAALGQSCTGRTLQVHGRQDEARQYLLQAAETFESLGDDWASLHVAHRLGDVEFSSSNYEESARWYRRSLRLSAKLGDELGIADALLRLGLISVEFGQPERAARFLGAAQTIHDAYNVDIYEPLRPAYERTLASLRASLGSERFEDEWESGRTMPIDGAVAYALQDDRAL
jgi:predicted ATPase/transcriptional regulator with XRE-family HTH domain